MGNKALLVFGKIIWIWITGVLAGMLLLALSALIPASFLEQNLSESAALLESEGDWRPVVDGVTGTQLDNYTDALLLQIAYQGSNRTNGPVFYRAMDNTYSLLENAYAVQSLGGMLRGEAGNGASYARYWLGSEVVLRILLCFLNYGQIRLLIGCLAAIGLILLLYGMYKKGYGIYIPAFLGMLVLWFPMVLFYSLQFSAVYFVMIASLLVYVWAPRKSSYALFFMGIGMMTAYVDFLTFPLLTLGIPLGLWIVDREDKRIRDLLAGGFVCSLFWGLGYAAMWGLKWIVGSLVLRRNLILEALRTVRTRTSRHSGDDAFTYPDVLAANFHVINHWYIWAGIGLAVLLILLVAIHSNKQRIKQSAQAVEKQGSRVPICVGTLILALFPFAWYMVTGNHSYVHSWYTFREYALTAWGLLLCLTTALVGTKSQTGIKE